MASKEIKVIDVFEENTCNICGCNDINQYFGINDNFIEYRGTFYSFRELLAESLGLNVIFRSLFKIIAYSRII